MIKYLTFKDGTGRNLLSFDGVPFQDQDAKSFGFSIQGAQGIAFDYNGTFLETSKIFKNWYFGVTTESTRLSFIQLQGDVYSLTVLR